MLYVLMMGIRERIGGQGPAQGPGLALAQGPGLATRPRPPTQGMLLYLGSRAMPNDKQPYQSRNNHNGNNHHQSIANNGGNNKNTSYQYKGNNNNNNNNHNNSSTTHADNETTKCELVAPQWSDICSLIISRNELAIHIIRTGGVYLMGFIYWVLTSEGYLYVHIPYPCTVSLYLSLPPSLHPIISSLSTPYPFTSHYPLSLQHFRRIHCPYQH